MTPPKSSRRVRPVFSGIGILPMIHGLEAHATFVRAIRSDCYPVLNQADISYIWVAASRPKGLGDGPSHGKSAIAKLRGLRLTLPPVL